MTEKPQDESIERMRFVERHSFTPLNDVLSFHVNGEEAFLHLAPIRTLSDGERMSKITEGLKILAERLVADPTLATVNKIFVVSWLVVRFSKMIEKLGFTLRGPITPELKARIFPDETREVHSSVISREDFLKRYGSTNA